MPNPWKEKNLRPFAFTFVEIEDCPYMLVRCECGRCKDPYVIVRKKARVLSLFRDQKGYPTADEAFAEIHRLMRSRK